MRLRSVLLVTTAGALVGGLLALGCSDDAPPTQEGDPTAQPGVSDSGLREAATDAASDAGGGIADGATEPNILACVDDGDLRVDGGASAPLACADIASCSGLCERVATRFKRGVAQAAIACLRDLGACGDANAARSCVARALGRACADTTAAGYCRPLVTACDPNAGGAGSNISQADCERFASSLSASGRNTLKICMDAQVSGGTCASDVVDCFRALEE